MASPLLPLLACLRDRRQLRTLALGQVISLLIAGTGVCSSYLAADGINVPTTQSLLNYLLLCAYAAARLMREGTKPLRARPLTYFLLALADVEANAIIVEAYQHTSITSVMLLDCASIPACMGLAWWFLGARFNRQHYAGVALCVAGIVVLALSDTGGGGGDAASSFPNALWGDTLAVAAACLYAVSNVGQEACLRLGAPARLEFLGALGVFGSIISGVQVAALERAALASIVWTSPSRAAFAGFAACLFAMYSLTSVFLTADEGEGHKEGEEEARPLGLAAADGLALAAAANSTTTTSSGAATSARPGTAPIPPTSTLTTPTSVVSRSTLFNLSLLTSDLWAIVASVGLFGQAIQPLYFLALALVVAGLVIYHGAAAGAASSDGSGTGPTSHLHSAGHQGGTDAVPAVDVSGRPVTTMTSSGASDW